MRPSTIPPTFAIINNKITTYRNKSVSLRTGSSSRTDDDLTPLVTPTTRQATRSRAQDISLEHEPSHHRDFSLRVDGIRGIMRLLKVLVLRYVYILRSSLLHADYFLTQTDEPFSPRLLHLPCASCSTNHCRGCFKPTQCPPNCTVSSSCPVRTRCPSVCHALFEVLCSFDKEYAGLVSNSFSGELINVVIAPTDKRTRAFQGGYAEEHIELASSGCFPFLCLFV